MTVAERPPIFIPSGKGFKAVYNLTFATDLVRSVYLIGSLQGDTIPARTLSVDNSANGSACNVNLNGATTLVAPFSLAYVDCTGASDVLITGGASAATVTLEVLTYVVAESVIVKKVANVGGLPPITVFGNTSAPAGVPKKIISLGAGVTAYLTFYGDGANSGQWGFTSACNVGFYNTTPQTISMDSAIQEFWVLQNVATANLYYTGG